MVDRLAMVDFRTGDILRTDAEALVNTVNCVGIMGRGVALQFKKAFPANFKAYEAACKRHEVQPGRMFVYETGYVGNPKFIINFPTTRHWRGKRRIEDIESGLRALGGSHQRATHQDSGYASARERPGWPALGRCPSPDRGVRPDASRRIVHSLRASW